MLIKRKCQFGQMRNDVEDYIQSYDDSLEIYGFKDLLIILDIFAIMIRIIN